MTAQLWRVKRHGGASNHNWRVLLETADQSKAKRRYMTRDEFDKLYVHRIFYQEAGTILLEPERVFAAVQSILQFGLRPGRTSPVLARTTREAELMGVMDGVPHVVFRGEPELQIGNDLSENIVCVVIPRKGESLFDAVAREVEDGR